MDSYIFLLRFLNFKGFIFDMLEIIYSLKLTTYYLNFDQFGKFVGYIKQIF